MRIFFVLFSLVFFTQVLQAQTTYTWTGAGDSNWNSPGNWDANGIPANSLANSDVLFNGTTGLVNTVNLLQGTGGGTYNLRTITFDASAGTFNITPSNTNVTILNIGTGGISVNGTNAQTISNPLSLGANQNWNTTTGGGNLFIDGNINATARTLTFTGGGNATVSQSAVITGGALVQNSTGITTLSANNTPTSVTVSQGTLVVNKVGSDSPIGSGPVTLSGGTLSFRVFGNPIAATGFNHDVITAVSEFGAAPNGTTRGVDGNNGDGAFVYFQAGVNVANPTFGTPANGRFTSNAVNYQFQDYTGNNVLSLASNATGALTLATPGQYRSLNFMQVTGSGSSIFRFRLNFADSTFTDVTGNASPDWFNGTTAPTIFQVNGRLNRNSGAFDSVGSGNPRIYTTLYNLSAADQLKTLNSVEFQPTSAGTYTFNVFGLSGTAGSDNQTYTNTLTVTADSTLDQQNVSNITLGALSLGTFTLSKTGGTNSTMNLGATTLTGNPTFNVAANNTLSLGALADGSSARTLTKSGPGTLVLNSTASSFGAGSAVNVTGGTLSLSTTGAIGTQTAITLSTSATLNSTASQTVASLAGTGGTLNMNANTLTINGGTTATYNGVIANTSLVVSGTNTNQTLSGTYNSNATTVQNAAKLTVATPLSLGTGATTLSGSGATLSIGAQQPVAVTGFGGTGTGWNLQGAGGSPPTITADVATMTNGTGGLANTVWFGTALPIGPAFTTTFRYSQLNGTNGADGLTFTIQSASNSAIGTAGGGLGYGGIGNSAAFAINIYTPNTPGITFATNGTQPAGYAAVAPVNLTNAGAGNEITVTLNYDGANITGSMVQGANTFTIPSTPINLSSIVGSTGFIGFTAGTGGVASTQLVDNFAFNILQSSTYTSPVIVSANAVSTLAVSATAAVPNFTMNTLTTNAGSVLTVQAETGTPVNQAYSVTFGATTLSGNTSLSVVNNGTGNAILALGATSGNGSLTKLGSGNLVLASANTYSGNTTITTGTMTLTGVGSFANSPVIDVQTGTTLNVSAVTGGANHDGTRFTIVNTQTLKGTGTVTGNLGVASGAIVSPGSSPGTLTINGNVVFATGSQYLWEIANTAPASANANTGGSNSAGLQDVIQITGAGNSISGTFTLKVTQLTTPTLNNSLPYSFRIATGPANATVNNIVVDLAAAGAFQNYQTNGGLVVVNLVNGDVFLNLTPVPEPGTILGLSVLGLAAGRWVRKRFKKTKDIQTV